MAEIMTQAEIDALLKSYQTVTDSDGNMSVVDLKGKDEVEYHLLICVYCKKIIESKNLDMHVLLAADKCERYRCEHNAHTYVSEEWLRHKKEKENYGIAGWRNKNPVQSNPRIKYISKITGSK